MKYTWGKNHGSSGKWEVLREIPLAESIKPRSIIPHVEIVLDGIENEYIAHVISNLLNVDQVKDQ